MSNIELMELRQKAANTRSALRSSERRLDELRYRLRFLESKIDVVTESEYEDLLKQLRSTLDETAEAGYVVLVMRREAAVTDLECRNKEVEESGERNSEPVIPQKAAPAWH